MIIASSYIPLHGQNERWEEDMAEAVASNNPGRSRQLISLESLLCSALGAVSNIYFDNMNDVTTNEN